MTAWPVLGLKLGHLMQSFVTMFGMGHEADAELLPDDGRTYPCRQTYMSHSNYSAPALLLMALLWGVGSRILRSYQYSDSACQDRKSLIHWRLAARYTLSTDSPRGALVIFLTEHCR